MKRNFDIEERGGEYLKIGWVCGLVIVMVAVLFIPESAPNPYRQRVEKGIIVTELPSEIKQLAEPPPPPKPRMPVEAETPEEVEQATIDPTDITGFKKVPPTPSTVTPDFVPYDTEPELVYMTKPEYPKMGIQAGIEGVVLLKLHLDTTGYVIDIKVIKSLNFVFDEAAVKAARTCRFTPAKQRDKPVRVWLVYPVRFKLRD